jgi:hypothetical protein
MTQQQPDHARSTADTGSATERPRPHERSDAAVTGDQQVQGAELNPGGPAYDLQQPSGPAGTGAAVGRDSPQAPRVAGDSNHPQPGEGLPGEGGPPLP